MTGGGGKIGRGKLRLFVALDLPVAVRRDLNAWRRVALTDPALRLTEGPRMLLLFLGHRPQREVVPYLEAIRELCARAPAPLIELGDLEARGRRPTRPRLFALPARSPGVEVLQIALRSAFESQGLAFHEPRQRAFWPHLTVARVRTEEERPSRRPLLVHDLPDRPLPAGLREPFRAESVASTCLSCGRTERVTGCWEGPSWRLFLIVDDGVVAGVSPGVDT